MSMTSTRTTRHRWAARVAGLGVAALTAAGLLAPPATASVDPPRGDRLTVGESLSSGADLVSLDGSHRLTMRADGSAAVVSADGAVRWQSKAAGAGARLTVRADGKVVLVTATGAGRWWAPPATPAAELFVLDSGQLAVFVDSEPVWWTEPGATGTGATVTAGAGPEYPALPRDAARHPFSSTSPWNTAIGSGAQYEPNNARPLSAALQAHGKPVVNREQWSVAVFTATPSDPLGALRSIRTARTFDAYVPLGTTATGGLDRHVTVIQPDGRTAFDTFKWEGPSGGGWNAQIAVPVDLTGPGTGSGVRAAGVPGMAGLIRAHELDDLHIPHALALAIPNSALKSGPVWPAVRQDSDGATAYTGKIPMGTLFAVPASVDVTTLGLSEEGLALARALQDYGAYVVDRAGTNALYCELACDPAATDALRAAWRILQPQLRAVTNNTATTVGGGGTPRVPPAGDLG